uniref:Uncharacterized protein n=1 Tax=Coccidioides posadasii RMSCC 3488 TaxID=454284 RepID=A0A0J6FR79_COCPO|nr:hypothetical protein CPAG_09183 [Coccidioides posadasii RMSCC 3488]
MGCSREIVQYSDRHIRWQPENEGANSCSRNCTCWYLAGQNTGTLKKLPITCSGHGLGPELMPIKAGSDIDFWSRSRSVSTWVWSTLWIIIIRRVKVSGIYCLPYALLLIPTQVQTPVRGDKGQ